METLDQLRFIPGRNCWKSERAHKFSVIIDGADYFQALRESLLQAERLIILVGWDFDFEIEMLPGESDSDGNAPDGYPNAIGPFLDWLVDRRPSLDIYLLKWSGGAVIAPGAVMPALQIKFLSPDQIHLAFDGRHPIGACHHQKVVSIDDSLAFCGGIDVTDGRWDTRDHLSNDQRRALKDGQIAQPWHDASTVMSGPAAAALSQLCRDRWQRANDAPIDEEFLPGAARWPDSVTPDFTDLAIARTAPPERDLPAIAEIEALYLDGIAAARDCIYLESQYFAADSIADAIHRRLQEPDGPEVVVINPDAAQSHVEDEAMHVIRDRMIRNLSAQDPYGRFTILYPVNDAGEDIYVHAKVSVIDDLMMRIGSSNIDRRSMGFDTESDVALLAHSDKDRARIRTLRNALLAEHLGVFIQDVECELAHGSVLSAIQRLNRHSGRGLRPITPRKESLAGKFFADTRFFDPRYRRSAQARLGVTSRHLIAGTAIVALGLALWIRSRNRRRR